ncbi:glycosyltransferase [Sphingomonas lacusdianchii]|uniref:glycosyltransferase n=1 Tax=Sphingomonas lacusdianchii TaxID=2917992 RepID=UPI001F579BAD|nr:hypothetical protein [Sphingomonas sp. JXJ CY 53]
MQNQNVSISPSQISNNPFVQNFADAVRETGRIVVDADWNMKELRKCDVAILHWPDYFFDDSKIALGRRRLLKLMLARRLFDTKFVWVVHNLKPHARTNPSKLERRFLRELDGVIHLSHEGKGKADGLYPELADKTNIVTVHGNFLPNSEPFISTRPVSFEKIDVLTFGAIKPYKNLEAFISALVDLGDPTVRGEIYGKAVDTKYVAELHRLVSNADVKIDAPSTSFSDRDMERRIDAADLIVLPYRDILNSGSAFLALSRYRPIVAPRLGALPELQRAVGTEWVYLFDGELDATTLADAVRWYRRREVWTKPDMSSYDWERVSGDLDRLLQQI